LANYYEQAGLYAARNRRLVDPARALQIWNSTSETLDQIASRFTEVNSKHVRSAIMAAVEARLGTLARPLPTRAPAAPAAPKAPRVPRPPREPSAPPAPRYSRENPAAPIPDNLPKAAPFNSEVERILANARPHESNYRESMREMRRWIIEAFDNYFADGTAIWDGKTEVDWLTLNRIRNAMNRERRPDLWTKCVLAMRAWHKLNGTEYPGYQTHKPHGRKYSLPEAILGRMGGLNNSQIARKLGVSGTTIREALRLADLEITSAA
jgi:hypothetical protein